MFLILVPHTDHTRDHSSWVILGNCSWLLMCWSTQRQDIYRGHKNGKIGSIGQLVLRLGPRPGLNFECGSLVSTRWHSKPHTRTQRNLWRDLNKGMKILLLSGSRVYSSVQSGMSFCFHLFIQQWISLKIYFICVLMTDSASSKSVFWLKVELFINACEKNMCFWCKNLPEKNRMTTKTKVDRLGLSQNFIL